MTKYRNIYPWKVIDALASGEVVYFVDKKNCKARAAASVSATYLVRAIASTEDGRFEFWTIEGEKEEK